MPYSLNVSAERRVRLPDSEAAPPIPLCLLQHLAKLEPLSTDRLALAGPPLPLRSLVSPAPQSFKPPMDSDPSASQVDCFIRAPLPLGINIRLTEFQAHASKFGSGHPVNLSTSQIFCRVTNLNGPTDRTTGEGRGKGHNLIHDKVKCLAA